jgi:kynurenine formamidase
MRPALLDAVRGAAMLAFVLLGAPAAACSPADWKACAGRPWVVGDVMETPLGERWWPHPVWGADDRAGATNWHARPEVVQRGLAEARTGRVYRLAPVAGPAPRFEGPGRMGVAVPSASPGPSAASSASLVAPSTAASAAGATATAVRGYNGAVAPDEAAMSRLHPVLARGFLLDIAAARGVPALEPGQEVTLADVREALSRQGLAGVRLLPGDAVLFRTGWKRPAGEGADAAQPAPGIGVEVARWLTDTVQAGLVGSDTPRTEVVPASDAGCGACVRAHLLVRHGVPVQDGLDLDRLAADAAWRFLYVAGAAAGTAAPLALR